MKTRIFKIKSLAVGLVGLFLVLLSAPAYSQACPGNGITLTIRNVVQTNASTIEYEIWMNKTSENPTKMTAYAGNVLYNAGMLPSGATGTLTVVEHPSQTTFPGVAATTLAPSHVPATRQLRWTFLPLVAKESAPLLPTGVDQKFCKFRFTSSLPFTADFNANLRFSTVSAGGVSLNTVAVYCNGNQVSTPISLAAGNLTLSTGNAQQTPFSFILSPSPSCPTAAAASNLVAESPCVGAANGSALITLTGAPNQSSAVTYTVDGGAVQNATLSASAFTVEGLSAGDHVVSVTYPTCSAVATSSFTIGAGAPLTTNGSVSTSICEGETYVWPANGQSYTTAQSGVTFVDGCNIATLNLTINPVTTTGSESVTACGSSYTWPVSGATYNASGSYDFVSGCNTATLTLTLNTSAQTYYADTDGDGFGAGAAIESCTGQPEGTVTNNTDCAPTNPLAWRIGNFFVDADGDGWNNGFPAAPVCYGALTPAGYTSSNLGTDCGNDDNALQNPNASEILGNEIDDNCDGTTDEVTPLSYLIAANCNSTLTNLSNTLFAYPLSSFTTQLGTPQGYRFRVTNGPSVRTYDSPTNSFTLLQLVGGATYATVYTVEVSVKTGGHYRAYGSACTVTTPAVPNSTNISSPACGSTLTDISNTIFCTAVPSASGYRFRVRNGATVVGTFDSAVNRFNLTNLGISNIAFGTTYSIDVLLAFGGNLRPEAEYGPVCSITTPATPGTSRVIQPTCGSSISNFWTTIFAQQVIGAQGYKFVVTNDAQTREFITPNSRFSLRNLVGGAAPNTAYTIRVDVLYNSSYVQGTVLCTINTTPGATRQTSSALDIYEVTAYPNPYADTFKLNVNTSSENQVGVRVYDMLGREVEARQASVSNITNLEIGSQYPSGVYNIIVTQGENVKTLRVIKR